MVSLYIVGHKDPKEGVVSLLKKHVSDDTSRLPGGVTDGNAEMAGGGVCGEAIFLLGISLLLPTKTLEEGIEGCGPALCRPVLRHGPFRRHARGVGVKLPTGPEGRRETGR